MLRQKNFIDKLQVIIILIIRSGLINLRDNRIHVPHLLWYLTRNLIGAYRVLIWLFPEPKIKSAKNEWKRNPKPHTEQSKHGGEWYCSRGVLPPYEAVEKEPNTKHNTWEEDSSLQESTCQQ